MLDPNFIRENVDKVREGMKKRGMDAGIVDKFLAADMEWRTYLTEEEGIRAQRNVLGKEDRERSGALKRELKEKEPLKKDAWMRREEFLRAIPNIPEARVPVGKDEEDNVELSSWGKIPKFKFEPKDHMELAGPLINKEKASEVSGSRFSYILGDLALLEFALIKYVFEKLLPHGFIPVIPPVLVKSKTMVGMGKTKFIEDEDAYYLPADDLYLVGTAEDSIGPLHSNEIIDIKELPKRYVGFSTAFRREAGTYGKDVKGILRSHQFDKAEMFSFTRPEDSVKENEFLLKMQEEIMRGLGLPYRVVYICTADMGFTATNQYDIETWLPSEGKYRESHSCSNTTDFQSRGLNIKSSEGEFVHMLNATGVAIGRMLIYILENNQTKDGKIKIPKALQPYVGKKEIKRG
ncbi:MAG: serine--tRNA ligase [Candidatus Colwellbacteria bacterium CG10_big_fil_rev_8_21_14_0_10_42_22]|uniref:Serine--tRNA ligase n=1 Tax=Candidatus Colwellbacteria bacterium CG10_big_fil_rev_8_21_14_0_10_42_22 TaxID=1974540 RepID=A0A2H0VHN0_9BACT|nr:MAG: serine--tRNA ligase [Candidatus Colwellbacteria bacterium CG10_big_fil_rev_8_21_14_0_10_42_22]